MKRFYIIITCQILTLLLFLSSHFLVALKSFIAEPNFFMTSMSINLLIDTSLFSAIGLQIMIILLLISLEVNNKK